MNISATAKAIRSLRACLNETQTQFGQRFGAVVRTVARWERDRVPSGAVLVQLMKLADANARGDLAGLFQRAIAEELGHEVPRLRAPEFPELLPGEAEEISILLTILRAPDGSERARLRTRWARIAEPIRKSRAVGDANSIALIGLHAEINKRLKAGESDEMIVDSLPKWNHEIVRTLAAQLRAFSQLNRESRR